MTGQENTRTKIFKVLGRGLLICLALFTCIFMLIGCKATGENDGDSSNGDTSGITDTTGGNGTGGTDGSEPLTSDEEVTNDNIWEFVTLGQYKGIVYDAYTMNAITDAEIDERINSDLGQWVEQVEVTDRAASLGDTVIIDFEGFVDGVAFAGGAAEGADLKLGAGQFIPGFEEQIVGYEIGDEFDVNVSFPDDYPNSPDLAGKPAVFKIKLHAILTDIIPELTEEFVQFNLGLDTIAEYRTAIREQLELEQQENADEYVKSQVWNEIINNATIHKYPQSEIELRIGMAMSEIEYMAMMYGEDVSTIVEYYTGLSVEDFIELQLRPGSTGDVGFDLILRAIALQEGIVVSDEEFNEAVAGFVDEYGYEDEEHFLSSVGRHSVYLVLISPRVEELVMASSIER